MYQIKPHQPPRRTQAGATPAAAFPEKEQPNNHSQTGKEKTALKTIKNKTYNNFIYVMKQIQKKGYTAAEAEKLTHGIFDAYESNPCGISIETRLNRIITKDEYNNLYAERSATA